MAGAARNLLLQRRGRLERMRAALEALSPLAILERGYALVFDASGNLVKDAGQVKVGDRVEARLAGGRVRARVEGSGGVGAAKVASARRVRFREVWDEIAGLE